MSNTKHADTAGASAPENEEGSAVASSRPFGAKTYGHEDSAGMTPADQAAIRAEIDAHDKRFNTLRTELDRRGYALHIVNVGNGSTCYLIQRRRDRSRELPDLEAVDPFMSSGGTP